MKERKFKLCGVLKKSDCIELIKGNLSYEELKTLINPNFNQLIRILNCMNKKELQYIVFNTEKLTIDKITTTIQKTAMEEKNTINKNFLSNDNDSEEEDLIDDAILHEENIEVKKLPAENKPTIKLNEKPLLEQNPTQNNNVKKVKIEEPNTELNEVSFNVEDLNTTEIINLKKNTIEETNMEKLNKVYSIKKVREILVNNGLDEEQITNYLKMNATKIIEKMRGNKDYGKHFINLTANDYKNVYELMRMI
jgi:hypothetical protein